MSQHTGTYGALLLSGFLGSLGHCLGMCGPLVVMMGARWRAQGVAGIPQQLVYHGARVGVYALLGAVVGGIGSLMGVGGQLSRWASVISLFLGLGVVFFGLGYLGWLPWGRIEGVASWLSRAISQALRRGGLGGVVLMGALNGLLPCGLVYSALLVAASTGGALRGAAGMLVFGSGTLPALLVFGTGAAALGGRARQNLMRAAGLLIVVVGLQLMLRGMAGLGMVPHLHLGGLVIW